jgi:hypothetical protein
MFSIFYVNFKHSLYQDFIYYNVNKFIWFDHYYMLITRPNLTFLLIFFIDRHVRVTRAYLLVRKAT